MKENQFHKFVSAYMPRWFNCIFAFLGGYFWLPCPLCGKNFGGHEWFNDYESLYNGNGRGEGVCPRCGYEKASDYE